jgi:putative transposase
VHKAFKYRLYPIKEQEQALAEMLETHRRLYNRALAERKSVWDERQESVSYGQQSAHLLISAQRTKPGALRPSQAARRQLTHV